MFVLIYSYKDKERWLEMSEILGKGNEITLVWLVLVIIFAVLEGQTLGLTSIWFSIGSLGGLIASMLGLPIMGQIIVFLIVTAVMLIYTRPIVKKNLKVGSVKTNVNALIGLEGIVTEPILTHTYGQVKLKGQIWTAKSIDGDEICVDSEVEIIAIEGVKVIVKKIEIEQEAKEEGKEEAKEEVNEDMEEVIEWKTKVEK